MLMHCYFEAVLMQCLYAGSMSTLQAYEQGSHAGRTVLKEWSARITRAAEMLESQR
jgi:hypothetical protein